MPGTFFPPPWVSYPDMHQGTCVTHLLWYMLGSPTSGFLWSRWRGKRSRHSRRMRNPQFYVSGKRPIPYRYKIPNFTRYHIIIWCDTYILYLSNGNFSYELTDVLTEIDYSHWTVNLGNEKNPLRMAWEVDNKNTKSHCLYEIFLALKRGLIYLYKIRNTCKSYASC